MANVATEVCVSVSVLRLTITTTIFVLCLIFVLFTRNITDTYICLYNLPNMARITFVVLLLSVLLSIERVRGDDSMYFPLLMPEVQPTAADSYLCTAFRMSTHEHNFIGND